MLTNMIKEAKFSPPIANHGCFKRTRKFLWIIKFGNI
jgi:hypothetical protein